MPQKLKYSVSTAQSKAYPIWKAMRYRCQNKANKDYPFYGGKGITVCDRWNDFQLFLDDVGEPPKGMELDRIDNNKGYSPDNCRWVSHTKNIRNNSRTKLDEDDVAIIKTYLLFGVPRKQIAEHFPVKKNTIDAIAVGRQWRDITPLAVA